VSCCPPVVPSLFKGVIAALFILVYLTVSPHALAQYPPPGPYPPGSPFGAWVGPYYLPVGEIDSSIIPASNPTPVTDKAPWPPPYSFPYRIDPLGMGYIFSASGSYFFSTGSTGPNLNAQYSAKGILYGMFIWEDPMTGLPLPNAPKDLWVLEDCHADYSAGPNGQGDVNDGWGDDLVTNDNDTAVSGYRQGEHLVHLDGSSGIAKFEIPLSGQIQASWSPNVTPVGCGGFLNFYVRVQPDTRGVYVSTSLGATYHRELINNVPTRVLDRPENDGDPCPNSFKLVQNTVKPDWTPFPASLTKENSVWISYTASPVGGWGANSTYEWMETMFNDNQDGLFNVSPDHLQTIWDFPPGQPILFREYAIGQNGIEYFEHDVQSNSMSTVTTHAFVRLTDSTPDSNGEQASATGNVYVNFHFKYGDRSEWIRDPKKTVCHPITQDIILGKPLEEQPDDIQHDWKCAGQYDNRQSKQTQHQSFTFSSELKVTNGGSINFQLGPLEQLALQTAINLNFSQEEDITQGATIDVNIDPQVYVQIWVGPIWHEEGGTCPIYDAHGYAGEATWYAQIVDMVGEIKSLVAPTPAIHIQPITEP